MHDSLTTPRFAASRPRSAARTAGLGPRLLILLLLAAALWAGLAPFASTQAVAPEDAPAALFSAERALPHLSFVAAEPRPIGSERSAAVRDFLLAELRALGAKPEVQRTLNIADGSFVELALVENIVARFPGSGGGKAVLLSAHYDSVATSTGASDCGACVAAVLEAVRAIRAGDPLSNDLIVLFTDGEEVVAAGASAFMRQHPWAQDVGVALVLEGLGTRGGSVLYISDRQGGWFTREALRAGVHPLGYSLIHEMMWSLAGNTGSDLDGFLENGGHGLGFLTLAMDSAPAYHTLDDNVDGLDMGSLQAHGDWLVSLARHFGNLPLESAPEEPPLVLFPLLPGLVARYPSPWSLPLALGGTLLLGVAIGIGRARGRLALRGVLAGVALVLLALLSAIAAVTLVWWLLRLANPALHSYRVGGWYGASLYVMAWAALSLAALGAWRMLWRSVPLAELAAGALLWWALFALLTGWALPGMSYVFAWPLLAGGLALLWWGARRTDAPSAWLVALLAGVPAAVALLLGVQMVYAFGLFAPRMESLTGLNLAALTVPVIVLVAALGLPAIEALLGGRRRWLAAGGVAAAFALLAAAWIVSIPTGQRPATSTLMYWLDADAGAARWITLNDSRSGRGTRAQLDPWTSRYFAQGAVETTMQPWVNAWNHLEYPALQAPAPVVDAPRSTAHVVSQTSEGSTRTVRIDVVTPVSVLDGQIVIESSAPVTRVSLGGARLWFGGVERPTLQINRYGRTGTLPLEIVLPAGATASLLLRDRSLGLPAVESIASAPRPATLVPAPLTTVADSTLVEQRIGF